MDANEAQDLESVCMVFGMSFNEGHDKWFTKLFCPLESFEEVREKCVTRDYDDVWDCSDVCANCWEDLGEEDKEGYTEITEDVLSYEWECLEGKLHLEFRP